MNPNSKWNWEKYKIEIFRLIESKEVEFKAFAPLIEECDELVQRLINRPLSYVGKRPHDFVVASLVTLSFRLSIISLIAELGGYADAVPILLRPLYEAGLRLLQIKFDPIRASLGYLLAGVNEEIRINESWLKHLYNITAEVGNLENNINNLRKFAQTLREEIIAHGFSPEEIVKEYGKLQSKQAAMDIGISEHFYNTNYGFMSGYVHVRGFSFNNYYYENIDERTFILGPCDVDSGSVFDILSSLIRNLNTAASIIGDADAESHTQAAYQRLNKMALKNKS